MSTGDVQMIIANLWLAASFAAPLEVRFFLIGMGLFWLVFSIIVTVLS